MLTTLLAPTAGTAGVARDDGGADPAAGGGRIGSVGRGGGAGHTQRARDELRNQGAAYGLSRAAAAARADELLGALELDDRCWSGSCAPPCATRSRWGSACSSRSSCSPSS